MNVSNRKAIKSCFTFVCIIGVAIMVGYWFYKYDVEDRDIGVVDYAPLKLAEDIKFPAVSICLYDPFLFKKLREINESITKKSYRQYLEGSIYDEMHEQTDYANLSIDLSRYFVEAYLLLRNGTELHEKNNSNAIVHIEVFNGFLGLDMGRFQKCMMMKYVGEDHRKVGEAYFYYDKENLLHDWQEDENAYLEMSVLVHYPNQFVLANTKDYNIQYFSNSEVGRGVWVEDFEILKRRNSRWRKCSTEIDNYDDMVLEEILRKRNCRPPYITGHKHYPKCDSMENIRDTKIEATSRYKMELPKACQRSSKIRNEIITERDYRENEIDASWEIRIGYPEEVKIITQSKDVDAHSLIGNIGGYLGLFLGNEYKLHNYDFLYLKFYIFVNNSIQKSDVN